MSTPGPFFKSWKHWRASSIAAMNDKSELQYGIEKLASVFRCKHDEVKSRDEKLVLSKLVGLLSEREFYHIASDVYCACFTGDDDLLSQWRAYGDNGKGVCLGLSRQLLLQANLGFSFRVIYEPEIQDLFLKVLAEKLTSRIVRAVQRHGPEVVLPLVADKVLAIIVAACAAIKNPAFCEEKEYRIVYIDAHWNKRYATGYYHRSGAIVPYVEFKFEGDYVIPLMSIRLGPCCSDMRTKTLLSQLIRHPFFGLPFERDTPIEFSSVPFAG